MGYNTDFEGRINIEPPLNQAEIDYLKTFSRTRRMHREQGPFYVDFDTVRNVGFSQNEDGVFNANVPPPGQPSLWCNFEPNEEGTAIVWNEAEKTYEAKKAKKWIEYIITRFLSSTAITKGQGLELFKDFQHNHVCNGELLAQGESIHDRWVLVVKNNKVTTRKLK